MRRKRLRYGVSFFGAKSRGGGFLDSSEENGLALNLSGLEVTFPLVPKA